MRNFTQIWSALFGDDTPEAGALRARQVSVLARGAPAMAIGNIVNSGLTALVFLGEAPWPFLLGWLAVIWLFAALRLKSWWRNRNRPRPEQAGRRALLRSTVWSCIAGSVWGLAAITLMTSHSMPAHVLLAFVVGGQAGAAAIWLSPLPAAYWTYIVISMAPLVAGFALEGEPMHLAMAGMLFVFTGALLLFARTSHKNFVETIKAGFERERLVAELEAAYAELEDRVSGRTADLSRTNQRLKEEIAARKQTEEELRASEHLLQTVFDAFVVWEDDQDRNGFYQIYARGFNANGSQKFADFTVNSVASGQQLKPGIAMAAEGDFVVVWEDDQDRNGYYQIYARGFNANGGQTFADITVNIVASGQQRRPAIAMR